MQQLQRFVEFTENQVTLIKSVIEIEGKKLNGIEEQKQELRNTLERLIEEHAGPNRLEEVQ